MADLSPDALAYLAHLRDRGPSTPGAAAAALGWPNTRVWLAEAELYAAKAITAVENGKARAREGKVAT